MARLAATFALLALALVLVLPGGSASAKVWKVPAPDTSLDPLTHLTEYENRVVIGINKARKAHDLTPVRYFSSCVDHFSESWARHLADTGLFEHRNQNKILRKCNLSWVGETLVRGTLITPGQMVKAWMHSPEHRVIILKKRANRAGVGVRLDSQGRFVGVLNFADTR
ncbi:CAP domain-containing protein [Nocardioides sp. KIGAM211]|uniref:CAP domain-containing protein n=1 Tax=Nocardioides luti TaxID=2761101 RepID=A0A7X0RCN9_9ACTN|nr:CAP domain-containing protein [Nocardioides luti]MBB6625893.1 CAP domain-containing protein [Nocardioides luti]